MADQLSPLRTGEVRELTESFGRWHSTRAESGKGRATVYAYGRTLALFADYCDETDKEVVDRDLIRDFVHRPKIQGTGPRKQAGRNREVNALRRFYKYLTVELELAVTNPAAQIACPEPANVIPRPIDHDEWLKVWLDPRLLPDERVWLGLAYFGGLRRSDVDSIRANDVDVERQEVKLFAPGEDEELHGVKGGNERIVEYGAMAELVADEFPELGEGLHEWHEDIEKLVEARQGPDDLALLPQATGGLDMNHSWVNKDLARILDMCGLDPKAWTPHRLRHSTVTNLRRAGVERAIVGDMVGHKNERTTKRYEATAGTARRLADRRKRDGLVKYRAEPRPRRKYKNR